MKMTLKFDREMRDFFDPLAMSVMELDGLLVAAQQAAPFRHIVDTSSVSSFLKAIFFNELKEWLPKEIEEWKDMRKTYNPHNGILTIESKE